MVSDQDHRAVVEFLYREARLADEARYAEWLALWTEDAVYWVPASPDPDADPETRISHIYDNRARLETRIKLLQTGHRYSQEPASLMRRLVSNVEVEEARTASSSRTRTSSSPSSRCRPRPRCTGGWGAPRITCGGWTGRCG